MLKYQFPMFKRLEPVTPWQVGRVADTDILSLDDAARFASKQAGTEILAADFLRAASRGEIPLKAIVHHGAKLKKHDGGIYCNQGLPTENTIPEGAIPTLPLSACQQLANAGRASWRTFDGFELMDGELMRFSAATLEDGEPDFETVLTDCRVMGWDARALADAYMNTPVAIPTAPSGTPESVEPKATTPEAINGKHTRISSSPDGGMQPDEESLFLAALRRLYREAEPESEMVPAPIPGLIRVARLVKILAFRSLEGSFSPNIVPAHSTSEARYMALCRAVAKLNDFIESSARKGSLVLRDEQTGIPFKDWKRPPGVQAWEKWAMGYRRNQVPPVLFSVCGADFSGEICVNLIEFADWAETQGIATRAEIDELLSEHSATSPPATEAVTKGVLESNLSPAEVSNEYVTKPNSFALPGVRTTDIIDAFSLVGKKWRDIRRDSEYWQAIHTPGGRGRGMHTWKPADFAICLLKTGERKLPGALRVIIKSHWKEWLPEFESQLEDHLNESGNNHPV